MKYNGVTHCGIYWSGWSAVIGTYRWLWVAKLQAWWHVRVENPMRIVTVESAGAERAGERQPPADGAPELLPAGTNAGALAAPAKNSTDNHDAKS